MPKLALLQPTASYGPEVDALASYVSSQTEFTPEILESLDGLNPSVHFALYRMMGTSPRWSPSGVPEIHDYASLSTGMFPRLKDKLKTLINCQPVFRMFLNSSVKGVYSFGDSIPSSLRDMGVPQAFLDDRSAERGKFTYSYCGSITRSRETDRLIEAVRSAGKSIILIGTPEDSIYREFKGFRGVEFTGRVPRRELPMAIKEAQYGINHTPNIYPFTFQTSTKILEYLALGMGVASSSSEWLDDFLKTHPNAVMDFGDVSQLARVEMESFPFSAPDMANYSWENVWERSGIRRVLYELAGGV